MVAVNAAQFADSPDLCDWCHREVPHSELEWFTGIFHRVESGMYLCHICHPRNHSKVKVDWLRDGF
jgi:hypothetical protein